MKIQVLSDKKHLPTIARWYVEEWGNLEEVGTESSEIVKLESYLAKEGVPLMLIAIDKGELISVVQIKEYEMSIYPNYRYWLGGVYVGIEHRNKGIAKLIVQEAIRKASLLSIERLYLQTEDLSGGMYAKLGWEKLEQVHYNKVDVLVMFNDINSVSMVLSNKVQ